MIVRFVVENIFSFDERKEFNMLPRPKLRTLSHHKYSVDGFDILKMSSIYGANGAGKSNLVKALGLLQDIVLNEEIPFKIKETRFKFREQGDSQVMAIEFFQNGTPYLYAIEILDKIFLTEELYISGLGKNEDVLIFERKSLPGEKTVLRFSENFEEEEKNQVLKSVLLEEFVQPTKSVLKLLSNRNNKYLQGAKEAFDWFQKTLQIITPESKPVAMAHRVDIDSNFKKYAEETFATFGIGIESIKSEKKSIHDFFGEDNENEMIDLLRELNKSPMKMMTLRSRKGEEVIITKEGNEVFVKQLKLSHTSNGKSAEFDLEEESDGTVRLLDFIPAFRDLLFKEKVFVIDELERSIHPLLIKELVKKFSFDEQTKGQLIFTTHESNLLDQSIFRQDEIWFAEKDSCASTDLYSLSDFKEHNTIDIRKGYLNGRYGSIPFLSNLEDLNWHYYDFDKQALHEA
jgi:AAA15 family ATPase/GTPase